MCKETRWTSPKSKQAAAFTTEAFTSRTCHDSAVQNQSSYKSEYKGDLLSVYFHVIFFPADRHMIGYEFHTLLNLFTIGQRPSFVILVFVWPFSFYQLRQEYLHVQNIQGVDAVPARSSRAHSDVDIHPRPRRPTDDLNAKPTRKVSESSRSKGKYGNGTKKPGMKPSDTFNSRSHPDGKAKPKKESFNTMVRTTFFNISVAL